MALIKTLSALFLLISLSACQSATLKRCQNLNWRILGNNSALAGKPQNQIFEKEKLACTKFKTPIDKVSFSEGYLKGVAEFCVTNGGYDYGETGSAYNKTCPKETEPSFLKGFYKGRLEYLQKDFLKHNKLYSEAEDRLWRKEREYLIIQNENPEQAKLEVNLIDTYREETRLLAQKKRSLKKEISKTKKLSAKSYF